MAIVNPTIYIQYHYDDGTTSTTPVVATSYNVKAVPSTFTVGTVSSTSQLFNEYGVNATSSYTSNTFTIKRAYSKWKTQDGKLISGNATINPANYANSSNYVHLYPVVYYHQATGTLSNGPYEYKNITITGDCNYDGAEDVTVTSSVRRQYLASSWFDCNGVSFSGTPGASVTITFTGSTYTYPTTLKFKGYHKSTTAWATYSSSKAISALPSPAARPDSRTYHSVTLTGNVGSDETRTEELDVSTKHSFTFSHWATTAEGTTAADTSVKPTTATTVYAVWTSASQVETTLPTWTSTNYAPDPNSYNLDTVLYFIDPRDPDNLSDSATIYACRNYPVKHIGWTLNGTSSIMACGSVVTGGEGSTYHAQFQIDKSKDYYETFTPEDYVQPTAPAPYKGYEYLGLRGSLESTDPYQVEYPFGQGIPVEDYFNCGEAYLYRVWKRTTPLGLVRIYNSTTKTMEKYKPIIYNSSLGKWETYLPKVYNGTDWTDIYS